jgi:hypothetical protein
LFLGKSRREGDARVVAGQFGAVKDAPVKLDGCEIPARGRAGERPRRSEHRDIVESAAGKRQERLERQAGCPGDPLHLSEQGHDVVGSYTGSRVVNGALVIGNEKRMAAETEYQVGGELVASYGEEWPTAQSQCADDRIGKAHERVERSAAAVRGQDVEPERARAVEQDSVGHRIHRRGDGRHRPVWHRKKHGIDSCSGVPRVIAPGEHA